MRSNKTIYGNRALDAVMVLNKLDTDADGNPVGLKEDRNNPLSANFGTERLPLPGYCLQGDGTMYLSVDVLSTDQITVGEGSGTPVYIADGQLGIDADVKVWDLKIYRNGDLYSWYKLDENNEDDIYDCWGGHHGKIIDGIVVPAEVDIKSARGIQNYKSWQNDVGYSTQAGANGYTTYIPRDESKPVQDINAGALQYKGRVGGRAKFVNSVCFAGDGVAYLSIPSILATDTVTTLHGSVTISDDRIDVAAGELVNGLKIERSGAVIGYYPLCEPYGNTMYDVSGNGNHATITDGTINGNRAYQDEYHYLQRGCKVTRDIDGNITDVVPILSDGSVFADGSALADGITQDGADFINNGSTQLEVYNFPALVQSENSDYWFEDLNKETIRKIAPPWFSGVKNYDNIFSENIKI